MKSQEPESRVPKLLVVDDQAAIRRIFNRAFCSRGFDVTVAQELEEAQALLELRDFDVLITDVRLSGLDRSEGLDVVSHARYHNPKLRIIVLTGQPSPALEAACLSQGADVFLAKPQSLKTLLSVVGGSGGGSHEIPGSLLGPVFIGCNYQPASDDLLAYVDGEDQTTAWTD